MRLDRGTLFPTPFCPDRVNPDDKAPAAPKLPLLKGLSPRGMAGCKTPRAAHGACDGPKLVDGENVNEGTSDVRAPNDGDGSLSAFSSCVSSWKMSAKLSIKARSCISSSCAADIAADLATLEEAYT